MNVCIYEYVYRTVLVQLDQREFKHLVTSGNNSFNRCSYIICIHTYVHTYNIYLGLSSVIQIIYDINIYCTVHAYIHTRVWIILRHAFIDYEFGLFIPSVSGRRCFCRPSSPSSANITVSLLIYRCLPSFVNTEYNVCMYI